jgi:amino acid transporter
MMSFFFFTMIRHSHLISAPISGLDDDVAGGFFPYSSYGGVLWRPYLNNLFWNLNSFDAAGTLVAELDNTALFLKAMVIAIVLVISCYFFPLLIAIGASDADQTDWTNGYFAAINTEVVGPWLGAWTGTSHLCHKSGVLNVSHSVCDV